MSARDKTLARAENTKDKPTGRKKNGEASSVSRLEPEVTGLGKISEQVEASDESEVDIRLDQDLSNFELPSSKSLYKDMDLDIDLTGPIGIKDGFIESQVLDIDPVKSFSRQVEINLAKLRRNGYIALENADTALSHSFRAIKRPLLNNVSGKGATVIDNANLIMLTSSVSGEGKTFSAINLALSMAMEKDKKILLVDADVSKPSHHEIFGVEMENGLTDYLSGRVNDVSRIINKTNVPSLSLIFSGAQSAHAIELFASEAMTSFLTELSGRYKDRVVIFDSGPLLLPTEASVLASHMGQVVIVVEAEYTEQKLVKQSIEKLDNRIVLLVLNKVRGNDDVSNYGYGHYGHDKN
jgi:receptor protein-tyrosine kinase